MANESLSAAKAAKNDEFYTQYYHIEREINTYLEFLDGAFGSPFGLVNPVVCALGCFSTNFADSRNFYYYCTNFQSSIYTVQKNENYPDYNFSFNRHSAVGTATSR